jgi:hypothetical protein
MFEQIMFAGIGWGDLYKGDEDLRGNFREPNESGSWYERFNFKSINNRCYGYIPPMGGAHAPPKPQNRDGWLVVFGAQQDGYGSLVPVGWYEDARFEESYTRRPETGLDEPYTYVVSAEDAYRIPKEKRSSFPAISTDHFKRIYLYARSPEHREPWRKAYADLAERIVSGKRRCDRIGEK